MAGAIAKRQPAPIPHAANLTSFLVRMGRFFVLRVQGKREGGMNAAELHPLRPLQTDNGRSAAERSAAGFSVSPASERVRRLNAAGIVTANQAIEDTRRAGLGLLAFSFVELKLRTDEPAFAKVRQRHSAVQEIGAVR